MKVLGWAMVAAPIVAVFAVMTQMEGWRVSTGVFVLTAAIVFWVGVGVYIATGGRA